jgi:hypothetical protein
MSAQISMARLMRTIELAPSAVQVTRLRWPYRGVNESEAKRLQPIARRILPELFQADAG